MGTRNFESQKVPICSYIMCLFHFLHLFKRRPKRSNKTILPVHEGNFRYNKIKVIGKGGQGTVYLFHDRKTGKKCAIKKISILQLSDLEPANNEVALLKNSNHPNLLKLKDIYVDLKSTNPNNTNFIFLVLEYVPKNLGDVIVNRNIRIGQKNISCISYQILCGINHLHKSNIIHRDIKPDNIAMFPDFKVKLLDFGISREVKNNQLTQRAEMPGTKQYKSPEMLNHLPCGNKIDIWPVGIIMADLILRRLFDFTKKDNTTIKRIENGTFNWDGIFADNNFPNYSFDNSSPSIRERNINPENARDLMKKLLKTKSNDRIDAQTALRHAYLSPWRRNEELDVSPIEYRQDIICVNSLVDFEFKERLLEKIHEMASKFQSKNAQEPKSTTNSFLKRVLRKK